MEEAKLQVIVYILSPVHGIYTSQIPRIYPSFLRAALLKSQGLDVKGLMKAAPVKEEEEEPEPYIDCTGHLQVLFLLTLIDLLTRC
jgi:hypothetical protein